MRPTVLLLALTAFAASGAAAQTPGGSEARRPEPRPIIDMHLHAGPGSARTLLERLDRHGVVRAVIGGPPADVERARQADAGRLIGSVAFPCSDGLDPNLFHCFDSGGDWPDLAWLRGEVEEGRIGALGELYNVYAGISPADPQMAPYFDLAAEYDLLVLAHADSGPPPGGRVEGCCPEFNGELGHPAIYERVLTRHPQLRLVLYHVFRPDFVKEAIRLMDRYPNVMVETSPMTRAPTPLVHNALGAFVMAGHADRIVFGSDYRGAIGGSIDVIESAAFLTEGQKQAILHDNAAHFLGIEPSR
jgi:hypothetical protein